MSTYLSMQKILTVCVLLGLLVPFILQTTLYPLFRFGMFAEPVRYTIQTERFELWYRPASSHLQPIPASSLRVQKSTLDYLLRNYYYRHETDLFLERAKLLLPDTLQLYPLAILRIVGTDTTQVEKIN